MATTSVLFVCSDNRATSIMAESILRASAGDGRFSAYSAGWRPAAAVPREVLEFLAERQLPTQGLAPKPYARFVEPEGPKLDFVILLDEPPHGLAPDWNGGPVVARWGLEDGGGMREAFWVLTRRLKIFTSLPHGRAPRRVMQDRVHSIAIWQ